MYAVVDARFAAVRAPQTSDCHGSGEDGGERAAAAYVGNRCAVPSLLPT